MSITPLSINYETETAVLGGLFRGPVRKSIHYSQLTIH